MIVRELDGESSRKDWPGDGSCAPYGSASSPPDSVAFLYGVTWVTSWDGMFLHHVTPWQHRVQLCSTCARPLVTPFRGGQLQVCNGAGFTPRPVQVHIRMLGAALTSSLAAAAPASLVLRPGSKGP